jgi:5-formyltetrahydrofolate cyclo-ligase
VLTKQQMRAQVRELRRSMGAEARNAAAEQFADHGLAWAADLVSAGRRKRIAVYLSGPTEPSTAVLIPELSDAGFDVLLPVCEEDYRLSWVRWEDGGELRPGPFAGVQEPVGEAQPADYVAAAAGLLIPALAVDTNGNRLGQGGGYYDRFLATLSTFTTPPLTAAMVFSDELVEPDTFPVDPLDLPVAGVLTPEGYLPTARTGL